LSAFKNVPDCLTSHPDLGMQPLLIIPVETFTPP
jgi:hypothetical protein